MSLENCPLGESFYAGGYDGYPFSTDDFIPSDNIIINELGQADIANVGVSDSVAISPAGNFPYIESPKSMTTSVVDTGIKHSTNDPVTQLQGVNYGESPQTIFTIVRNSDYGAGKTRYKLQTKNGQIEYTPYHTEWRPDGVIVNIDITIVFSGGNISYQLIFEGGGITEVISVQDIGSIDIIQWMVIYRRTITLVETFYFIGQNLPNQCIGDAPKPKTTNATLSYNSVDYPIGIRPNVKTVITLGMFRVIDSQGLVFWRDKDSTYDKIESEIEFSIDDYNTEFNEGTQIDKMLDIMTGVIDTVENPYLTTDTGVFPFTPLYDAYDLREIAILDSKYNRASDIKQRWNSYKLKICSITDLPLSSSIVSCNTISVWSLGGVGLPMPTIKENQHLVFSNRQLQGGVDKYKTPTIAKGEVANIEVTVTNSKAQELLSNLKITYRSSQFIVTNPSPLYLFGQNNKQESFNCILYSEKITCEVVSPSHCKIGFSIQNRGSI